MDDKQYQLIIVSDLHLSEGWNPDTKRLSRNEDFFFDLNFQRFLQHLAGKAERGGFFYKLIINGDFVDFLQFTSVPKEGTIGGEMITQRERELGLGTSTIKTLWKLDILMNGHWIFFYTLKEFIQRGNEVIIIPGNHDIEWMIPEVQIRFKEKLSSDISEDKKGEFTNRIQFVTWFYYDSSLSVFVEHGSQYDNLNSFDYFLYPFRKDKTLELPAGSFFVRYLFNRVEQYYPFADNMKPMSKFIWWAVLRYKTWFSWPPRIFQFIKFFWDTLRKAKPIDAEWEKELDIQHEKELQMKVHSSGLNILQSQDIKKQWVPSALHNCSKLGLLKCFRESSKIDSEYYLKRAINIQQILDVRYVVFGHTHEADIKMLLKRPDGKNSEYVNSGTWTKTFAANYEEALLKGENEFVYVDIRYHEAKKDVKMELLRWNDGIREGERVRLFTK